jgi:tetratricopeptide (TPR) repeat protein
MHTKLKQAEALLWSNQYRKARDVYRAMLTESPDDHWLLTRIASTYYEERRYKLALRWSDRALKIMPECPLVLWNRADIQYMLGQDEDARQIWMRLIRGGVRAVLRNNCNEGVRWSRALIADCMADLGRSYADQSRYEEARKYFLASLKERRPGDPVVWSAKDVHRYLAKCDDAR